MGKFLKWIGKLLVSLIGLLLIAVIVLYALGTGRLNKKFSVTAEALPIPADAASVARGEHFAQIQCQGCHGDNMAGGLKFFDDPAFGVAYAPNLTPGKGGLGGSLSDADYIRAIRHGIRPDGTPMLVMPNTALYHLSDEDLGAVIAYAKSLPPVDNVVEGPPTLRILGRVLAGAGQLPPLAAEAIDHTGPRPVAPQRGATAEYGDYLVASIGCSQCHGPQLSGGHPPEPDAPPAPNLTPGGELLGWTGADFTKAMRAGLTPGGRQLNEAMPWKNFGHMTDDELTAVWLYLHSLPKRVTTTK